jgi:hypothetical protein
MRSLIQLIERKLERHGVKKIVPNEEQLAETYRLFVRSKRIQEIIEKALEEEDDDSNTAVPDDLRQRVEKYLTENSAERWDTAVSSVMEERRITMTSQLMRRKGRSGKAPRHVRLYHWLQESPAWRSLSANARAIYVAMAYYYVVELQDRGFIVIMKRGAFSLKVRHATEWRLTEFPCDVSKCPATKDFMRWHPKKQNTGSVAELSSAVAEPSKYCSGTNVVKMTRDEFCSGTVEANFSKSRVL